MNYILSIAVAAIRALSMFFVGKIILLAFGTQAFAAHAQLAQLVTVLLPVSCGLTTLAMINAWANLDRLRALWVLKISVSITVALVFLSAVLVMTIDTTALSQWAFGTSEWQGALLVIPIAVALASATSLATASLVGIGKGRWAAIADACMSLCALALAAIAAFTANIKWLIFSPLPILGIGVLAAGLAIIGNRGSFATTTALSSTFSKPVRSSLGSYMLMSLAASAIAPAAILLARSTLLNEVGADAASSFVAAQRLVALAVAPVPFYVYTFLSHFFASATHEQATQRIRKLQMSLLLIVSVIYAILAWALPVVTPIVFSDDVQIPALLFILVALGEMARVVAALQAQYLATHGRWKTFLIGDFVFLGLFLSVFLLGGSSGTWIAGAYGLAGVGYLIYMTTWGAYPPKGISYGT